MAKNTIMLSNEHDSIIKAADIIKSGGIIAFPTETVFGLFADPDNQKSVEDIYNIKYRESNKPLSIMVNEIEKALNIWKLKSRKRERVSNFLKCFWPGALTLVCKKEKSIFNNVTAGRDTIGIRYPDYKPLNELLIAFNAPLASTSANISGEPDLNDAEEVFRRFKGLIDAVFPGKSVHGRSSTVIELDNNVLNILRKGFIKPELILKKWIETSKDII